MKPARSPQETACLPTLAHSARIVSATSSEVATVDTTSTSFMIGAGLKKCMPMTSCGREVTLARLMIGRLEVVVARIAPGLQISSRFSNRTRLDVRGPRRSPRPRRRRRPGRRGDVEPVSRPSTSPFVASSSLPRWIALSSDRSMVALTPSTFASLRPTYVTSKPALAKTSTMPLAMVPVPTTPTLADRVLELRLVVGRRREVVGDDDRGCRAPRRCRSPCRSSGRAGPRSPSA